MKLRLQRGEGVLRHLSPNDLYFTTDVGLKKGQRLNLELEVTGDPGGPLWIDCAVRIVRIEKLGADSGIAATITRLQFRRIPEAANDPASDAGVSYSILPDGRRA